MTQASPASSAAAPSSRRVVPFAILERTEVMACAIAGGTFLLQWTGEPTLEAVERVGELVGEQEPGVAAVLVLISPTARPPSPGVRAALARQMTRHAVQASAVIIEDGGFRGAAIRAIATGIGLLARAPYRHRVFASSRQAASWLSQELEQRRGPLPRDASSPVRQDMMEKAVELLRAASVSVDSSE